MISCSLSAKNTSPIKTELFGRRGFPIRSGPLYVDVLPVGAAVGAACSESLLINMQFNFLAALLDRSE